MTPRRDLLGEAVDPPTHNYDALLVRIDHERPPFFGKGVRRGCGEWPGAESNCRHADFQSAALPTELPGRRSGNLTSCNHFCKRERQWIVDAPGSQRDVQRDSLPNHNAPLDKGIPANDPDSPHAGV